MFVCFFVVVCCVGSGLCDELITHPDKSYRVCMCVCDLETCTVKPSRL
jgi:hypothetical protein